MDIWLFHSGDLLFLILRENSMLGRRYTFKSSSDYKRLISKGERYRNRYFKVSYESSASFRIGTIISKKYGNAVDRNRLRRTIHEEIRKQDLYKLNYNIVISPTFTASEYNSAIVKDLICSMLKL